MSDISGRLRTAASIYDASYPPDVLNGAPDPHITTLTPNTIAAGAPATTVTVTGTNFEATSVVEVDGIAQATTFVSPTSLTISYDPVNAGTEQFTVRNTSGKESNSVPFTVGALTAFAAEPEPEQPDPDPGLTAEQVSGWTVDQAMNFVIDHPDQADDVAALERDGKARVTLLTWLEEYGRLSEPTDAERETGTQL